MYIYIYIHIYVYIYIYIYIYLYICDFIVFEFLQVPTVFTKNVYLCFFRISLFFEKKFIIHMLFLFSISTFVARRTIKYHSEDVL